MEAAPAQSSRKERREAGPGRGAIPLTYRRPLSRCAWLCVNSALTAVVAAVHPLALTPHEITVHPKNAALTLVLLALTVATNLKKVRRR